MKSAQLNLTRHWRALAGYSFVLSLRARLILALLYVMLFMLSARETPQSSTGFVCERRVDCMLAGSY